jgi:trans-aconitate 2-methyltransferase
LKFAQPRLRPAIELLLRVDLHAPGVIYDLGCGTGTVTRLIADRWPDAGVLGIDGSGEMLARAREGGGRPRWLQRDLAGWRPEQPADLIYSNAALHWLPDHRQLFPALVAGLAPGGVLAVQMPRNFSAPSHTAIADTVRDGAWRERLEPLVRPTPVAEPAWYLDLLAPLSADVDVWETEYYQVLHGTDPVKEWTKGTWLAPFLAALDGDQRPAFEAAYAQRVASAYPRRADGSTVLPFRRLFIVARKLH